MSRGNSLKRSYFLSRLHSTTMAQKRVPSPPVLEEPDMRLTSSALCVLVLATPILVGQQSAPDGQDAKKDKPKVYEVGSKIDSKLSLVDLNGKQHTLGV